METTFQIATLPFLLWNMQNTETSVENMLSFCACLHWGFSFCDKTRPKAAQGGKCLLGWQILNYSHFRKAKDRIQIEQESEVKSWCRSLRAVWLIGLFFIACSAYSPIEPRSTILGMASLTTDSPTHINNMF